MILREILKKIRQIEIRATPILNESEERGCVRSTPESFRGSASNISNPSPNHLVLRPGLRPHRSASFRRCASRFFNSDLTCSQGTHCSGCFTASSARRSSSLTCSGDSSGSYPLSTMLLQTCCVSSKRSSRLNSASILAFSVFQAKTPSGIGGAFQSWKPSMNSSQRRCASSTRSSKGSFFAAERNFATDMKSIYWVRCHAQAGISPQRVHHSAF